MSLPAFVLFVLMPLASIRAAELLKDQHTNEAFVFESDSADVPATIEAADAIKTGTEWTMRFYDDPFLKPESFEFRLAPIRFWLLAFARVESKERVFAVVLPDGTIVPPKILERS